MITQQESRTLMPAPAPQPEIAARRVLMVTPRYWPLIGGIETHIYEVARRMVAAGTDVTICTTDPSGRLPVVERQAGVQIVRVRAWPAKRDYYLAPDIRRVIATGGWDIVHCQGYHTLVAPLAMAAAWSARMPYVVSFHSGGHSSGLRNAARGAQRALLRPLLARAARLVAVSQFEANLFQAALRLPANRFVVIPNGAKMPEVSTTIQPEHGPLIVSVGRLERYKGHQRMIAAFPHVLLRHPDARLRIIGSGPYEATLHEQVRALGLQERITIGAIAPSDRTGMAEVVASAALVVLLSDYEAHPVSVMEALALGRQVLVTNTSGLQELAERNLVTGIPLDSSTGAVAAAVLDQLAHPRAPQPIALPTWEQCAADLLALYDNVVRARSQVPMVRQAAV